MTIEEDRERVRRIAQRLLERTEAGQVKWRRVKDTPSGRSSLGVGVSAGRRTDSTTQFQIELSSGHVVGIASEDEDHDPPYRFFVRNEDGVEVEALRTRAMRDRGPGEQPHIKADNALLRQLYGAARDSGLGVSQALAAVEKELGI